MKIYRKKTVQRLLKLATFLRTLPDEKFFFGDLVYSTDYNNCGTICCALGWTPAVFPKELPWSKFIDKDSWGCAQFDTDAAIDMQRNPELKASRGR